MNKETILEFIAAKSIYDNACSAASKTYQTANDTIWFLRRETHAKVSKYRYYDKLWKTSLDAMGKQESLTGLYHQDRVIDCGYRWDYETDWHDEEIAVKIRPIQAQFENIRKECNKLMAEFEKPYMDAIQPTINRLEEEAKAVAKIRDVAKSVYDEKYEALVKEIIQDKIYDSIKPIIEKFKIKPDFTAAKDGDKLIISPEFSDTAYGYTDDEFDANCRVNATSAAEDAVGEMEDFITDLGLDCKSTIEDPEVEDFEYHGDERFPTEASAYYTVIIRFEI